MLQLVKTKTRIRMKNITFIPCFLLGLHWYCYMLIRAEQHFDLNVFKRSCQTWPSCCPPFFFFFCRWSLIKQKRDTRPKRDSAQLDDLCAERGTCDKDGQFTGSSDIHVSFKKCTVHYLLNSAHPFICLVDSSSLSDSIRLFIGVNLRLY